MTAVRWNTSIPFEDTLSNVIFIGVLSGVLIASLALSGGSMQLANRICGGSETGFFWSLFAYFTGSSAKSVGRFRLVFSSVSGLAQS